MTKRKITKADLIAKLRELSDSADTEGAHESADGLLLAYINDADVSAAYEAINKWYA